MNITDFQFNIDEDDGEGDGDSEGDGDDKRDDDTEGDDDGALNYSLCWFKRPRS